ncbi:MAG: DUF302 domain-containing protein [Paludibacter sp.]|nr:DUF302 domain-containing protein [Paludibacter sp.]
MKYYTSKTLKTGFEDAVEKVTEALKKEGFGVLSEIDIHEKLKEKLNVDFRKYKILGACNPKYAYEALQQEDKVGLMLPCNVIIQELDNNLVEVAAINPVASMMAIENQNLSEIAVEIKEKLERMIASL